ncbi:ATP-dependent DNA ligase [Candidatus Nitrosocosmicus sp. FF01]|jgi:DNA ligase-1|uniref:ATP-dependent DNA ligase n=1 Tax=Candidatus Nitrosocosmicus sp. FF01 TaxID=3397670 RepID=UPI0039EC2453
MIENIEQTFSFSKFTEICELVRNTSSKNKKVDIISAYLSSLDEESLYKAVLFLSGRIFSRGSPHLLNVGFRTIMQSLFEISDLNKDDVSKIHLEHGDLGRIAEYAISKKRTVTLFRFAGEQLDSLTLNDIYLQFKKIANLSGPNSNNEKKNILKGLLIRCTPIESKYLIKIITNEMRIGSYEGLVEIAIAKAFDKSVESVREALLISGDISNVALLSKSDKLQSVTLKPFVPMNFMLADVMFTGDEIVEYFNKSLYCEFKYDGIRLQLHRFGDDCKLFSRNLSDISFAFPEIVESAIKICKKGSKNESKNAIPVDFVLDGELIGYKDNKPLPFQELQKRLRKKVMSREILREIPVQYIVYDVMFYDRKSVIRDSLATRKKLLSRLLLKNENIIIATSTVVAAGEEIDLNFKKSKSEGYEGLVIKDPESNYHPGKRGRYWIKLKEELDTIDAVVVMAEYGHGKRAGTLSDYTLAINDFKHKTPADKNNILESKIKEDKSNMLRTIGKAYSGLSNDEINFMTNKLKTLVVKDEGSRLIVKPEIVLEVSFDTIQKSDRHDSGYALRFPRIKNIRFDKGINDIDNLEKVENIYRNQFHIRNKVNQ